MSKDMRYKTTVTYVTGGREYRPGDILPADISPSDLAFLKSKKFAVPAESEDDEDGYEGLERGSGAAFPVLTNRSRMQSKALRKSAKSVPKRPRSIMRLPLALILKRAMKAKGWKNFRRRSSISRKSRWPGKRAETAC